LLSLALDMKEQWLAVHGIANRNTGSLPSRLAAPRKIVLFPGKEMKQALRDQKLIDPRV
jgi:hypothetical protein